MENQVLLLLKSTSKDHPLNRIIDQILMPELSGNIKIKTSNICGEFNNFTSIYRYRHKRLIDLNVENYGIEESIAGMNLHPGLKRTASIQTQKFNVTVWMNPDLNKLIGLILLKRSQINQLRNK
jgi:hypothetical protein